MDNGNKTKGLGSDKTWNCKSCQKLFSSKGTLSRHVKMRICLKIKRQTNFFQKPEKYHCKICFKVFKKQYYLQVHIRSTHMGSSENRCDICHKVLCDKQSLRNHKLMKHSDIKPPRNYHCDICEKSFYQKRHLFKHRQIHSAKIQFFCPVCNQGFTRPLYVKTHMEVHNENRERNHHCPQCDKTFLSKGVLNKHLVTHSGEQKFLCPVCPKRFSRKYHLICHSFVHSVRLESAGCALKSR